MSTRTWIIVVVIVGVVGAAAGRFSLPAKVVTQIKTVTIVQKEVNKDDHSTTTTIKAPDGTTTTVVHNDIVTNVHADTHSDAESTKTTTYNTNRWLISAIAGYDIHNGQVYGGSVSYRLLGPISVGAVGLSNGVFGASVGLSF